MNCLLAVDTVASWGGAAFSADALLVDAVYTGLQKVLGVPPGLAPISFGERAVAKLQARKTPPSSFYLDMSLIGRYWSCFSEEMSGARPRMYHHTAPTNAMYGLREGLAQAAEEGLEKLWQRHANAAKVLHKGLESLGLELFVPDPSHRLPTVTTIKVPQGVDFKAVVAHAMKNHRVEIAGGLGPTAGKVWRVGLMGANGTEEAAKTALKALAEALEATSGFKPANKL